MISEDTGEPLAYVNIGIPGKDKGTVSKADGSFKFWINENDREDLLNFSIIGYESKAIKIKSIDPLTAFEIKLKPKTYELQEVVVKSSQTISEIAGYRHKAPFFRIGMGKDNLGSELGALIQIKHAPAYIENFSFDIWSNDYKKVKLRLNLYKIKNGIPDEPLLNEPIYIETSQKKGLWKVDLSRYNISVTGDFFVSLEYIENLGFQGLYFHGKSTSNLASYYKIASQAEWKEAKYEGKYIAPTFFATISYAKE